MIQLSAPSNSAGAAKTSGIAASVSPNGAETGNFAALLGAAGSAVDAPEGPTADVAAVLTAALAGLPDGKTGKESGKTLPVGEIAAAGDLEIKETPDEATSDQADVPITAAIPVLPLIVPPLPGTGTPVEFRPVEFRAAGPDSVALPPASASTAVVLPQHPTLPTTASQVAPIATAAPVAQQATAGGIAPAQVLQVKLAPIVATDVQSKAEGVTEQAAPISTAEQIVAAKVAITGQPTTARPVAANPETKPVPPIKSAPDEANASANTAPTTGAATQNAAPVPSQAKAPTTDTSTEKSATSASPATASLAETGGDLKRAEGAPQPVMHIPNTQTSTATAATNIASVGTAAPAVEQPHDFATLVSRLSEAREAASPQVVSTALHHAEFGKVSLQFRHDDANLSVTMANADPAFTAAVHSAVAASLGGNAGNSDQPRDGQPAQQQQQQPTAQQQSASSGNGGGQSQQQAAQARAENGERTFNRGQGASARAQQGDSASSSDHAENGTRRSGIYA